MPRPSRSARRPTRRRARLPLVPGGLALFALLALWFGNDVLGALQSRRPSASRGTPARGSVEASKRLPTSGRNFVAYSRLGALLGRNSVHSAVRATLLDAYAALAITHPDVRWVYGETGWPRGGPFRPHQTHQNGLSVDFMVPVRSAVGRSERLPTWPWQQFGYALEFDSGGRGQGGAAGLTIDFAAIAAHLATLADVAHEHGLAVDVVIFAPEFERRVLAMPEAKRFRGRIRFARRPPWVRHDEHYHVNFRLLQVAAPDGSADGLAVVHAGRP